MNNPIYNFKDKKPKETVTEEQVGKFIGIYLLGPLVVMLCWNFVKPYIFGLKAINYLHAAALLIISRFITLK